MRFLGSIPTWAILLFVESKKTKKKKHVVTEKKTKKGPLSSGKREGAVEAQWKERTNPGQEVAGSILAPAPLRFGSVSV